MVTNPKILHIHCAWFLLLVFIVGNSSGCSIVCAYLCNGMWVEIYSNVFLKRITSIPVTKHPPVSASDAEAATFFKCCNLHVLGHLGAPVNILEVYYLRENTLNRNRVLVVQSDITHWCLCVKSCLKREIWPIHLDMSQCNPKMGAHFYHFVLWGHFLLPL